MIHLLKRCILAFLVLLLVIGGAPTVSAAPLAPQEAANDEGSADPSEAGEELREEPYRNPETVALRSLVVPGWGQQVNGQSGKGWFLTGLAVFGILLGTETLELGLLTGGREKHNLERDLGWFMYAGAVAWATIDGYMVAQRLNRENGYDIAHWPGPAPSRGAQLTLVRVGF